jgi:hypothetical protein
VNDQEDEPVFARVATFQSDPGRLDDTVEMVRKEVAGETPDGLKGAKMLMLIDRETGRSMGITLFDSEEAMRRGDQALNQMDPGSTERRTEVQFYEVPVETISG